MATQRDLRRRITSVQNTRKITKAMEMVAAARLRRAQQRIEATRPYAIHLNEFMAALAAYVEVDPERFPLLKTRDEVRRAAVVSLTADRGLSGAFNANVVRRTLAVLERYRRDGVEVDLTVVGRKGVSTLRFRGVKLAASYVGITDRPSFLDAQSIAHRVIELYANGEVDRVTFIFNRFKSAIEQELSERILLPIQEEIVPRYVPHPEAGVEFLFEPSAEELLTELLPNFVEMSVYRALLESTASEFGARMTAMRNASDSAAEMIDSLTLAMNRARQASITQELLEVVAGAEALK